MMATSYLHALLIFTWRSILSLYYLPTWCCVIFMKNMVFEKKKEKKEKEKCQQSCRSCSHFTCLVAQIAVCVLLVWLFLDLCSAYIYITLKNTFLVTSVLQSPISHCSFKGADLDAWRPLKVLSCAEQDITLEIFSCYVVLNGIPVISAMFFHKCELMIKQDNCIFALAIPLTAVVTSVVTLKGLVITS